MSGENAIWLRGQDIHISIRELNGGTAMQVFVSGPSGIAGMISNSPDPWPGINEWVTGLVTEELKKSQRNLR